MAKKQEKNPNSLIAASEELGKILIELFKSKAFTRAGKDLADALFASGVEAGALVSGIAELTDRKAKITAANRAILKLNETVYIAKIMQQADYYRPVQVKPLISYAEKILDGLKELLKNVPEVQHRIRVRAPIVTLGGRTLPPTQELGEIAETVQSDDGEAFLPVTATIPEAATIQEAATAPVSAEEPVAVQDDGNEQMAIPLPGNDSDDDGFGEGF